MIWVVLQQRGNVVGVKRRLTLLKARLDRLHRSGMIITIIIKGMLGSLRFEMF